MWNFGYCVQWLTCMFWLFAGAASRAEGPRLGPRSPSEAMTAFVLADPALTIELVAAEPEVTSPVAIAWDEDGRLYRRRDDRLPGRDRHRDGSGGWKIAMATAATSTRRSLPTGCRSRTACCLASAASS